MQDETINIQGKKYRLVPIEEETHSILDDYKIQSQNDLPQEEVPEKSGIKDAVPQVSDYRERFKRKELKASDVIAPPARVERKKVDSSLDSYSYKGEGLFFGPGLEDDIS